MKKPPQKSEFHDQHKPWTATKHKVARKCLTRFAQSHKTAKKIFFVDGFTGPGILKNQAKGFGKISAEVAHQFKALHCINVEAQPDVFDALEKATSPEQGKVLNLQGKFQEALPEILKHAGTCPRLFFLDPYGTECIGKNILQRLAGPSSEVLLRCDAPKIKRIQEWGKNSPHPKMQASYKKTLQNLGVNGESSPEEIAQAHLKNTLLPLFPYGITFPIRNPRTKVIKYWMSYATHNQKNFLGVVETMAQLEEIHRSASPIPNFFESLPKETLLTKEEMLLAIIRQTGWSLTQKEILGHLQKKEAQGYLKAHVHQKYFLIFSPNQTKGPTMKVKTITLEEAELPANSPIYKVIRWTPETAAAALEKCNEKNRHCPQAAVSRISTDIKAGNFALTHQGIGFDNKGNLVDGQTRLKGIVESGLPTCLYTCFNLPEIAHTLDPNGRFKKTKTFLFTQDLADLGRARSFADMLTFDQLNEGVKPNPKENKEIASIVKKVARHAINISVSPNAQLKAILAIYQEDIDAILKLKAATNAPKMFCNSAILSCIAITRRISPDAIDKFTKSLFKGTNLREGDPAYALRSKLTSLPNLKKTDVTKDTYLSRLVFYSLMAVIDNKDVYTIQQTDRPRDRIREFTDDAIKQIRKITGTDIPSDELDFTE